MAAPFFATRDSSPHDSWYLTNGVLVMGPVALGRLMSGVGQGSIPATSLVRHTSWNVWRRAGEIRRLPPTVLTDMIERLGRLSAGASERASGPHSQPPPPLDDGELRAPHCRDSAPELSSVRPAAVDPVGVLAQASSLDEALLLTLSTAVSAVHADVGLLHRRQLSLDAIVTSAAHGTSAEAQLGERVLKDDPSLVAARAGHTVLAEPHVGPIGRYIASRLSRAGGPVRGVAMVPITVGARLLGMLEVGRRDAPFRAREVGRVEDVVEALISQIVVSGWLAERSGVRRRKPVKSSRFHE